LKNKIIKKS